jgi:hypothetical protein
MSQQATIRRVEEFPPAATNEETAEEVFARNKTLIEKMEPIEELGDRLDQAIADEHDMMDRKYAALDRRVKRLELRGAFLPEAKEENILFWLAVGFFVIEFVIPAVVRLMDDSETGKATLKA